MAVVRGLVGRKPGGVRWSWHGMAWREVKKVRDGGADVRGGAGSEAEWQGP